MKKIIYCLVAATALAAPALAADGAGSWLDRTTLSVSDGSDSDIEYEIETIQPLMQTPETKTHTVFVQGRVAKQDKNETVNVGLGYRHLNADETMLMGVNAFYDATTEYGHRRASLGLEAIGKAFTARANIYSALSKEKKKVSGSVTTYQSALDGYDVSLDMPVPYTPWARLQATGYKFSALKDFKDVSGSRITLAGNLNQNLSFEAGADDNNYNGTDSFVKLTYSLSGISTNGITATLEEGMFGETAYGERDLKAHTLDKVVRNNNVVVQTRGGVVVGRSD